MMSINGLRGLRGPSESARWVRYRFSEGCIIVRSALPAPSGILSQTPSPLFRDIRKAPTPALIIPVPPGTVVKRKSTGALLGELINPGVCVGGGAVTVVKRKSTGALLGELINPGVCVWGGGSGEIEPTTKPGVDGSDGGAAAPAGVGDSVKSPFFPCR